MPSTAEVNVSRHTMVNLLAFVVWVKQAHSGIHSEWLSFEGSERLEALESNHQDTNDLTRMCFDLDDALHSDFTECFENAVGETIAARRRGGPAYRESEETHPTDRAAPLIETIAEILQDNHARTVLHGEYLESLRDAVLTPGERGKLKEKFRHPQHHCVQCGKVLSKCGFAVTGVQEEAGTNLYCYKCNPIGRVVCDHEGCIHYAEMPRAVVKYLSSTHLCPQHQAEQDNPPAPEVRAEESPFDVTAAPAFIRGATPRARARATR